MSVRVKKKMSVSVMREHLHPPPRKNVCALTFENLRSGFAFDEFLTREHFRSDC